jgi:hypothetical protein
MATNVGVLPHVNEDPEPLITPFTVVVTLPLLALLPKYNGIEPADILPLIVKLFASVFIRTIVVVKEIVPAYILSPLMLLNDPTLPDPNPFNVNTFATLIPPCNCNVAPLTTLTVLVPNDVLFLTFNDPLATLVAPL